MAIPDRDYQVGDVVWCVDPFKLGADHSRLFAVISTRTHPFEDEQFLGATITTTDHTVAHPSRVHIGSTADSQIVVHPTSFTSLPAYFTDSTPAELRRNHGSLAGQALTGVHA